MPKLIIHHEQVNEHSAQLLVELCPFNAIEYTGGVLSITAGCKMCRLCIKNGPSGIMEYLEDETVSVNKDDWRGVAVFAEQMNGEVSPVVYELLGKAQELAAVCGHPVYALLIGSGMDDIARDLLRYGADKIFVYDLPQLEHFRVEPYAAAFEDFVEKVKPSSVLVGATNLGRSLAPRVAARFGTGLTADCTRLEMKENSDLVQIRPAFGGNIMAQIITPKHRPQFCTVRYKIFSAPPCGEPSGEIVAMTLPGDKLHSTTDIIEVLRKTSETDISEAEAIVAVGRGIKSEKDLELAQQLAEALDAQLACTRPLIENGWFGPKKQIGLSGRTVKPKIIVTLGISGAVQFIAGMQNADCIIAVNSDESAPIFNVAHYGLVGDLYEIVPDLLARIQTAKQEESLC